MTNEEIIVEAMDRNSNYLPNYYVPYWKGKPILIGKKRAYLRIGDLKNVLIRNLCHHYIGGSYPNGQYVTIDKKDVKIVVEKLITSGELEIRKI